MLVRHGVGPALRFKFAVTSPLVFLVTLPLMGHVDAAQGQATRTSVATRSDDGSTVVAIVNGGRVVTESEVDGIVGSQIFGLQERIYLLRKAALESIITRLLIDEEARAQGLSPEEVKNRLVPERVSLKPGQIEQVYAENAASLGGIPEDEAKQRIRLDLESRQRIEKFKSALAGLRARANIEVFMTEPVPPLLNVNHSGPSRGPELSPVTIIEFSDFQCPYCRQVTTTLEEILDSYPDSVRLVFKHLPLGIHPHAFSAARAAVCAGKQDKFWEFHDHLFATDDLSPEALVRYVDALNMDREMFTKCLDSEESRSAVLDDLREARRAEIHGTPSFVVNGKLMRGVKSFDEFKRIIDAELAKKVRRTGSSP